MSQDSTERYEPEGGLSAYVNRARASHPSWVGGQCACGSPLCGDRLLLDHIDDLVESYLLKVGDFARETARNAGSVSQDSTNTPTPKDELVTLLREAAVYRVLLSFYGEMATADQRDHVASMARAVVTETEWRPPADDAEPWRAEARIHERRATSLGYCEYVIETYPDGEDDTCSEHRERGTVFCVQHQPDDDTETEWRLVAGADCYEAADEDDARKEAERWPASPLPVVEARSVSPWKAGPWKEQT